MNTRRRSVWSAAAALSTRTGIHGFVALAAAPLASDGVAPAMAPIDLTFAYNNEWTYVSILVF